MDEILSTHITCIALKAVKRRMTYQYMISETSCDSLNKMQGQVFIIEFMWNDMLIVLKTKEKKYYNSKWPRGWDTFYLGESVPYWRW